MRFVRQSAAKDLRRAWADRLALVLYLAIPLAVGALISLATGGTSGPRPVTQLLVADEDDSFVSGLFLSLLQNERAAEFVKAEKVERAAGLERIGEGDASAMLVIPPEFGDALLREEPSELLLVTNPAESIKPKILADGMEVLVDGVFYLHRLFGDEIRDFIDERDTAPSDDEVATISVAITRVVRKIEKYLFPPALEIETVIDEERQGSGGSKGRQRVSLAVLFLPGILLMSLLFMAQGLAEDAWKEREGGTLRRIVSAPVPMAAFLASKSVATAVLVFGISLILLMIGFLYTDIPWERLPLAVLWSTLSGVVFGLLFMWITMHARTRRAGAVITNSIVFPLLMLGGSFFPIEIMPKWMGKLSTYTPNGWSLAYLKDILLDRADAGSLLIGAIGLFGVGLVLFLLCAHRMRSHFARDA